MRCKHVISTVSYKKLEVRRISTKNYILLISKDFLFFTECLYNAPIFTTHFLNQTQWFTSSTLSSTVSYHQSSSSSTSSSDVFLTFFSHGLKSTMPSILDVTRKKDLRQITTIGVLKFPQFLKGLSCNASRKSLSINESTKLQWVFNDDNASFSIMNGSTQSLGDRSYKLRGDDGLRINIYLRAKNIVLNDKETMRWLWVNSTKDIGKPLCEFVNDTVLRIRMPPKLSGMRLTDDSLIGLRIHSLITDPHCLRYFIESRNASSKTNPKVGEKQNSFSRSKTNSKFNKMLNMTHEYLKIATIAGNDSSLHLQSLQNCLNLSVVFLTNKNIHSLVLKSCLSFGQSNNYLDCMKELFDLVYEITMTNSSVKWQSSTNSNVNSVDEMIIKSKREIHPSNNRHVRHRRSNNIKLSNNLDTSTTTDGVSANLIDSNSKLKGTDNHPIVELNAIRKAKRRNFIRMKNALINSPSFQQSNRDSKKNSSLVPVGVNSLNNFPQLNPSSFSMPREKELSSKIGFHETRIPFLNITTSLGRKRALNYHNPFVTDDIGSLPLSSIHTKAYKQLKVKILCKDWMHISSDSSLITLSEEYIKGNGAGQPKRNVYAPKSTNRRLYNAIRSGDRMETIDTSHEGKPFSSFPIKAHSAESLEHLCGYKVQLPYGYWPSVHVTVIQGKTDPFNKIVFTLFEKFYVISFR